MSLKTLGIGVVLAIAVSLLGLAIYSYAQTQQSSTATTTCTCPCLNVTAVKHLIWRIGRGFEMLKMKFHWGRAVASNVSKGLGTWSYKGLVTVSEEYRDKVVSILKSDPDTSKLLSEGYNVTLIKPIIRAVVGGNGEVTLKASQAIVVLTKQGVGRALAYVDVEQGKVLKLIVTTIVVK